jgi:type II secretory pathway component PulF
MKYLECAVDMATFTYRAYDANGGNADGQIETLSLEMAKKQLQDKQLMVVEITEDGVVSDGIQLLTRRRVSAKEIEYLTGELSLLLNSGVTIDRGLGIIRRNSTSAPQAKLVANLHDAIRRGESLSDAMATEEIFNPLYINLVKLGEASGTLPRVFARLSEDIKFQSELKSKITQALIYPAVIFSVCILCVVFVFNYIVPQMSGLFEGMPEIPFYTAALLDLSDWMIKYQWFLLLGIIAIIAAIVSATKNPLGRAYLDSIITRLPILDKLFILIERIRFNTAIAMMLESGILINRCLEMALGSVKNQKLRQGLTAAKERVKKGDTLTAALRTSPLYNDFAISLIEVGEESGALGPVFSEISGRSRREFESWVDRMTSLLEPLLILVMGGIVGGVVVVMLLSIVSVNEVGF